MRSLSYIKRNLENVVSQVTKEYPVVLVTGPRQVGKTTMLQKLMEGTERGYVTLDDLNERNIAKTDPELFLQLHKPPVLIDIVLEHDGVLNPIEIKKTSNPGTELVKVFDLLDKSSTPRAKGAVICMKPGLSAIDRENYIVPIWMI